MRDVVDSRFGSQNRLLIFPVRLGCRNGSLMEIAVETLTVRFCPSAVHPARDERQVSGRDESSLNGYKGEGFRVPAGVRKPLMQEPAGPGGMAMEISISG